MKGMQRAEAGGWEIIIRGLGKRLTKSEFDVAEVRPDEGGTREDSAGQCNNEGR